MPEFAYFQQANGPRQIKARMKTNFIADVIYQISNRRQLIHGLTLIPKSE